MLTIWVKSALCESYNIFNIFFELRFDLGSWSFGEIEYQFDILILGRFDIIMKIGFVVDEIGFWTIDTKGIDCDFPSSNQIRILLTISL